MAGPKDAQKKIDPVIPRCGEQVIFDHITVTVFRFNGSVPIWQLFVYCRWNSTPRRDARRSFFFLQKRCIVFYDLTFLESPCWVNADLRNASCDFRNIAERLQNTVKSHRHRGCIVRLEPISPWLHSSRVITGRWSFRAPLDNCNILMLAAFFLQSKRHDKQCASSIRICCWKIWYQGWIQWGITAVEAQGSLCVWKELAAFWFAWSFKLSKPHRVWLKWYFDTDLMTFECCCLCRW